MKPTLQKNVAALVECGANFLSGPTVSNVSFPALVPELKIKRVSHALQTRLSSHLRWSLIAAGRLQQALHLSMIRQLQALGTLHGPAVLGIAPEDLGHLRVREQRGGQTGVFHRYQWCRNRAISVTGPTK